MKSEYLAGTIGTSLSVAGTIAQTNEVLQTISLIITILGALISFVVVPLVNWYRKAKDDGKITPDEFEEGLNIAADGVKKVADETSKEKDKREEIKKGHDKDNG